MPIHTIRYACGHGGAVEIYGRASYRKAVATRMEVGDCPDCQGGGGREKPAVLTRQTIWALSLRASRIREVQQWLQGLEARLAGVAPGTPEASSLEATIAGHRVTLAAACQLVDTQLWIVSRNLTPGDFLEWVAMVIMEIPTKRLPGQND